MMGWDESSDFSIGKNAACAPADQEISYCSQRYRLGSRRRIADVLAGVVVILSMKARLKFRELTAAVWQMRRPKDRPRGWTVPIHDMADLGIPGRLRLEEFSDLRLIAWP
jgi:hypothetical protein